jgi:hypothetical protein
MNFPKRDHLSAIAFFLLTGAFGLVKTGLKELRIALRVARIASIHLDPKLIEDRKFHFSIKDDQGEQDG